MKVAIQYRVHELFEIGNIPMSYFRWSTYSWMQTIWNIERFDEYESVVLNMQDKNN